MPRLSKIQWDEIKERFLNGESGRSLAREYDVTEGAIRKRFAGEVQHIKQVAHQVVEADRALNAMPNGTQKYARALIESLQAISVDLASAATAGAATARELAMMANEQVAKIDRNDPMETQDVLQSISALTKMSNEASAVPISLLNANRNAKAEPAAISSQPEQVTTDADAFTRAIAGLVARGRPGSGIGEAAG